MFAVEQREAHLESLSKKERQRQRVVNEILSSERSYVAGLGELYFKFFVPCRTMAEEYENSFIRFKLTITHHELRTIFSNIEILWQCNVQFLQVLYLRSSLLFRRIDHARRR